MSSILDYFKSRSGAPLLPNPRGSLSSIDGIPAAAIASANRHVERALCPQAESRRRGKYQKYTEKQRAQVGRYAAENGVQAAVRKFSREFNHSINESTIRGFMKAYLAEVSRKRRADEADLSVDILPTKKRGRPLLLGDKMDTVVKKYIIKMREKGAPITTAVVIASARGLLTCMDRTRLQEFGGPATLTKAWAQSLLRRMNFSKRKGTTKSKDTVVNFERIKQDFLQEIIDVIQMEEIPAELIFNWDQTGLNLVPAATWTMEKRGKKRVAIKGLDDKRQITGVFCANLTGEFLPIQLIYGGKTNKCHPPYSFPSDWHITHSENHWANESTMLSYIEEVIVPFVERVRSDLGCTEDQPALALFDRFRGQLTEAITKLLESNNIHCVLIPANCTDKLQPLDLTVNRSAKAFLQKEFQNWYAGELKEKMDAASDEDEIEPVDLTTARMKCVGAQWLVRLYEYLCNNPHIIVNGFHAASISQSIDAGKPILNNTIELSCDEDGSDDSDSNTDSDLDEFSDDEYSSNDDYCV